MKHYTHTHEQTTDASKKI